MYCVISEIFNQCWGFCYLLYGKILKLSVIVDLQFVIFSVCLHIHRRTGHFFLGELSHLCPKIFRQRPKNCYVNLKNYFARLTPPSNY